MYLFTTLFRLAIYGLLLLFAALIAGGTALWLTLTPTLPEVDSLRDMHLQIPLRIYTRDGLLLGEFGEQRRSPVQIDAVPPLLVQAFLAAEDARFREHRGVDVKGLLRAFSELVSTGAIQSGGSTITMQVAKNYFLSQERTFSRKFNEILLALKIEQELDKDEILELYFNKIYLGNRAYGLEAAANVYYGTSLGQLTLAQMAMIAGLPKAPSAFNPLAAPERALLRRNWILDRMHTLGMINATAHEHARRMPITARYNAIRPQVDAPYVAELGRLEAARYLGPDAYTGGYVVTLSIDSRLQQEADLAVRRGLIAYSKRHGYRGPLGRVEVRLPPDPPAIDHKLVRSRLKLLSASSASARSGGEGSPDALPGPTAAESVLKQKISADGNSSHNARAAEERDVEARRNSMLLYLASLPANHYLSPVVKALESIAWNNVILPAWIQSIDDDRATVTAFTLHEGHLEIPFKSMAWANKYIGPNEQGPAPKVVSDVLQPGDLVYVERLSEGGFGLSQKPVAQAALISLRPDDGSIAALSGGFDFYMSKFNRALQAKRQPGSNFKPFIYLAALEKGHTAADVFNDAPVVFDDASLESTWRPENASGEFYGPTRLRKALYLSRNLVSIRLLRRVGIPETIEFLDAAGFPKDRLSRDLSLALGSATFTPLEIAEGYATLANGGTRVGAGILDRVRDIYGNQYYPEMQSQFPGTIYAGQNGADKIGDAPVADEPADTSDPSRGTLEARAKASKSVGKRIADPRNVYILNDILKDVIRRGTATDAQALGRTDLAGKTGTTNDQVDAWFSGYTPRLATTVWVGFDSPSTLGRREYGGRAALPIWLEFTKVALVGTPEIHQRQPAGIVSIKIDPESGERAHPGQSDAVFELFTEETVPPVRDDFSTGPRGNAGEGGENIEEPAIIF